MTAVTAVRIKIPRVEERSDEKGERFSVFLTECRVVPSGTAVCAESTGASWVVARRYSEFAALERATSPLLGPLRCKLPGKVLLSSTAKTEKRREGLELWLSELTALERDAIALSIALKKELFGAGEDEARSPDAAAA